MTVRNAVEIVARNFPNISQKEIIFRLDAAQKLFARVTRCLVQWIDYTPSGAWYSLDGYMQSLIGILFLDTNGKIIDPETLDIQYTVIDRHLVFVDSTTGEELSTWPANVVTVRLRVRAIPADVTAIGGTFAILDDFHDALVSKVMADLYMLTPNTGGALDLRREHIATWARILIEGKRYANTAADDLLTHSAVVSPYAGS